MVPRPVAHPTILSVYVVWRGVKPPQHRGVAKLARNEQRCAPIVVRSLKLCTVFEIPLREHRTTRCARVVQRTVAAHCPVGGGEVDDRADEVNESERRFQALRVRPGTRARFPETVRYELKYQSQACV